jgi:hypothetical protein
MAIDMSDIVLDSDLGQTQPIKLARALRSVSDAGLTVTTPYTVVPDVYGIVTPASQRQLNRLPEGDRQSAGISIISNIALTAGGDYSAPDMVQYEGKNYLVNAVDDWIAYGYNHAIATMTDMQGPDPWATKGV